jgi:hypothetical protein
VKVFGVGTILAVALVVAPPGETKDALPQCAWKAPKHGPSGLPVTLSLETRCADFHLRPDGSLRPNGHGILYDAAPRGSIQYADGSWWQLVGGRLTANRGAHRLWRSSRRYPRLFDVRSAAVGAGSVAFTYRSRLFVAAGGYRAVERLVAHDEWPLGWTDDGLLFTSRGQGGGGEVRLRAPDGTLLASHSRRRAVRYDTASETILAVTPDGRVERIDGSRTTSLARLRDLGMPAGSWLEPLAGGLIGISTQRRVAILRADGSLFASARFPNGRRWNAAGNSGLVASADGDAAALTLTEGNTGYASRGAEWLLALREGDRVARALHREPLRFAVCERWASLAWHGPWLLYSGTEGRTLALDTTARRLVALTPLVAGLPGATPNGEGKVELQARWAAA